MILQSPSFNPGYATTEELRTLGFAHVGKNVMIAHNCTLIGLENIHIGDNVRIDGQTTIAAARGHCRIGRNVHIGGGTYLACAGGLDLADFVGLSQGVRIYTISDDYSGAAMTNPTVPPDFTNVTVAPVTVGRHVIIGSGSVVLPGVEIGEGVAVGALSLVTKSLDAWGIYAGNPARRLRERSKALLDAERRYLEREV
ncbi:acetyltransferase [Roseicyclus marinus]|uniref:Chloramphenicol acetyltransferase n=1 Tax=Roseicyclus marinus TaxID=2161673 RepID=A0AA48KLL0_9RHOB|nr:acetyltransferase [Roseicyclus marinus]